MSELREQVRDRYAAGALSMSEYGDELMRAGFVDISIDLTHELAEEIFSANVLARKPA